MSAEQLSDYQANSATHTNATTTAEVNMEDLIANHNKIRFYPQKFPLLGESVMARYTKVTETAVYCELLEYAQTEAMIPLTELSRKYIPSIPKFAKLGKVVVGVVLRVDAVKGYVDLSLKAVTGEDKRNCEERFNKARAVQNVLIRVAGLSGVPVEEIQDELIWPLYRQYVHALDGLKLIAVDADLPFAKLLHPPSDSIRHHVVSICREKLKPKPTRVRADITVVCYNAGGIDAIKDSLNVAKAHGARLLADLEASAGLPKPDVPAPFTVAIIAPPHYCLRTETLRPADGIAVLQEVISILTDHMRHKWRGEVAVTEPPHAVGDDDSLKKSIFAAAQEADPDLALLEEELANLTR